MNALNISQPPKAAQSADLSNDADAVNKGVKQVVLTALLFDCLFKKEKFISHADYERMYESDDDTVFEIEDLSIQFITEFSDIKNPNVLIHRNLHPETQKVFGFRFSNEAQIHTSECDLLGVHLSLLPSIYKGPQIGRELLSPGLQLATFEYPIEPSTSLESHFGASLAFKNAFVLREELNPTAQTETAIAVNNITDYLNQLDVACKMAGSYSPYLELLK